MGKIGFAGGKVGMEAPSAGILASELAVGSSVYLMENGAAVEYLVVNQGIPSGSTLYDASCDGTWLLRKELHSERQFGTSNVYTSSMLHTWLNGDFFNSLGSAAHRAVNLAKIPYWDAQGSGSLVTGANGLSTKAFILGGYEVGFTEDTYTGALFEDGVCLEYFKDCSPTAPEGKRIAYLAGVAKDWWIRIPYYSGDYQFLVTDDGYIGANSATATHGARPALILNSSARFDAETMILKGVA